MKKMVRLFYRNGNNDKCFWDIEVDSKELEKIMDIDYGEFTYEEIEIQKFGLTVYDIPSIIEWGFDLKLDHNIVSIISIDNVDIKKLEKDFYKKLLEN